MKCPCFPALYLITGLLISVLGLLSCSSDNSSTLAPSPEIDPWRLKPPTLLVPQSANEEVRSWSESALQPVPVHSYLVFSNDSSSEALGFQIKSVCRHDLKTLQSDLDLQNVTHVPVQSLLPRELFTSLASSRVKDAPHASCSFSFTVKNSLGSTHKFDWVNVTISEWTQLEILALESASSSARPFSAGGSSEPIIEISQNRDLVPKFKTIPYFEEPNDHAVDYSVICEHFENHRKQNHLQRDEKPISSLLEGPIQAENGLVLNGGPENDPRMLKTDQKCRIIARTRDSTTGVPLTWMTPAFHARFPLPPAKLSWSSGMRNTWHETFKTDSIYEVSIQNDSPLTQAYRFPLQSHPMIALQPVVADHGKPLAGKIFHEQPMVELRGALRSWEQRVDTIFEVAPWSQVVIKTRLNSSVDCLIIKGGPKVSPSVFQFAGFTYQFANNVSLRRYRSWNPANPDFGGETTDVTPAKIPSGGTDAVLEGWLPHQFWVDYAGEDRPSIELYPSKKSSRFCFRIPAGQGLLSTPEDAIY